VLILRALDDARKGSWHVLLADRAKRRPAAVSLDRAAAYPRWATGSWC